MESYSPFPLPPPSSSSSSSSSFLLLLLLPPPSSLLLPQASVWCQTTQLFLNDMDEKIELTSKSEESGKLMTQLSHFISTTSDQQDAKMDQVMMQCEVR